MPVDVRAFGLFGSVTSLQRAIFPACPASAQICKFGTEGLAEVVNILDLIHGHARCGKGGKNAQLAPAGAAVHGHTNSMYVSSDSNVWHGIR